MSANAFQPTLVLDVESSGPLPTVPGDEHGQVLALVRRHGQPLGRVSIPLPRSGLTAATFAAAVHESLGDAIARHDIADGPGDPPSCVVERNAFLAASPPPLTVVVPTRDRPERLASCLDSILACAYPADRYEVIVADNAPSTEATHDLVRRYADGPTPVRYVREPVPGSASARNAAIRVGEGDVFCFTDDDVMVDEHWLTELARGFQTAREVACVTGLVVPAELETAAQHWFEQYGGFDRGFEQRVFDLHGHRAPEPLYPYSAGVFGTGNNMAFSRAALRRLGGFDPALGNGTPTLGGVDSEMLLRTIVEGHRIVYRPQALVHHYHRADYAALRRQIYSYGVGLTAYLLKTLVAHPRLLPDFLVKLPPGLRFAFDPRSAKNERKLRDYPAELTRLELRGMLKGPYAYARSRHALGTHPSLDEPLRRPPGADTRDGASR